MSEDRNDSLAREAEELRSLVRELSERLAHAVASLPLDAALAVSRGADTSRESPFHLENWRESIEVTAADARAELELLWKRLPPRESP